MLVLGTTSKFLFLRGGHWAFMHYSMCCIMLNEKNSTIQDWRLEDSIKEIMKLLLIMIQIWPKTLKHDSDLRRVLHYKRMLRSLVFQPDKGGRKRRDGRTSSFSELRDHSRLRHGGDLPEEQHRAVQVWTWRHYQEWRGVRGSRDFWDKQDARCKRHGLFKVCNY